MKLTGKLLIALVLAVGVAGAQAANIVNNGSFETGDFTGWTQTGNTGFTGVFAGNPAPGGGSFAAFFGPFGSIGGITQTLTTLPGQFYTISFAFEPDGGTPSFFSAVWGAQTLFSVTNPAASGYQVLSFLALATSLSTTLSFNFRDDPGFLFLDSVSVSASVPEPASLALLGIALGGMGFARRRTAKT